MQYMSLNTYIVPHFDLCCVIWGNCTHNLEKKMVKLQKRAARVIIDCGFYTPSCMMFSELKWMTFPERGLYQKAIQMFKPIEGNAPEYLRTSFTFAIDSHSRLLRSSSFFQLYTPKPHLEIYRINLFFLVHPFGIFFLHISKTQTQFIGMYQLVYVANVLFCLRHSWYLDLIK